MKYLLLFLVAYTNIAGAIALNPQKEAVWKRKFTMTCVKRFEIVKRSREESARKNSLQVCSCIANNQAMIARKQDSASMAYGQLEWLIKYYADPAKVLDDPYGMKDAYIYEVDNGCYNDPVGFRVPVVN